MKNKRVDLDAIKQLLSEISQGVWDENTLYDDGVFGDDPRGVITVDGREIAEMHYGSSFADRKLMAQAPKIIAALIEELEAQRANPDLSGFELVVSRIRHKTLNVPMWVGYDWQFVKDGAVQVLRRVRDITNGTGLNRTTHYDDKEMSKQHYNSIRIWLRPKAKRVKE